MAELNEKVPKEQGTEIPLKEITIQALGGVDNADLIDLLTEWQMENSLYVYPLMEMKGYEIDYSYDVVCFKHPKQAPFEVAVKSLKDICFKAVKERSVTTSLERVLGSYLKCNVQQTYCIFDQWGYFPNGNKEILEIEEPDIFIVDKQRKVAVSHASLLAKLNELLQLNEATNLKYTKLWKAYREEIAEGYPEEFARVLLSDEPLKSELSHNFYHRDSYGIYFVELSGKRVLRIPVHIIKDLSEAKLEFVAKEVEQAKEAPRKKVVEEQKAPSPVKPNKEEPKEQEATKSKQGDKTSEQNDQQNRSERGKANNRSGSNNQRQNNGRRGRYDNNAQRGAKRNAKFNTERYLISEEEINYIVPVGWRNQLLNLGAFGQFILDIWIAFKLVGRIRKNRD